MEIYALFNKKTGVFQCSIFQRTENTEGDFDEVGDYRWINITSERESFFEDSSDWFLISEEDYKKYAKGKVGGDNNTGYIFDFETQKAISAPPLPPTPPPTYEEKLARISIKFVSKLEKLRAEYVNAALQGGDTSLLQNEYDNLVETSNAEIIALIESAE